MANSAAMFRQPADYSKEKKAYPNLLKTSSPKTESRHAWKFSTKKSDICHISAQNIDCDYSFEPPPRRGSFNGYPQSMFLSKIMYTPVNPVLLYKSGVYAGQNYIGMFSWWLAMNRFFSGCILESYGCEVCSRGQRKLWSVCSYAQAYLSSSSAVWIGTFSHGEAHFTTCWVCDSTESKVRSGWKKIAWRAANCVGPDQTPHTVTYHLDLHCLLRPVFSSNLGYHKYTKPRHGKLYISFVYMCLAQTLIWRWICRLIRVLTGSTWLKAYLLTLCACGGGGLAVSLRVRAYVF